MSYQYCCYHMTYGMKRTLKAKHENNNGMSNRQIFEKKRVVLKCISRVSFG